MAFEISSSVDFVLRFWRPRWFEIGYRWSLVWLAVGVRERLKKHIVIYNSMKKLYVYEKKVSFSVESWLNRSNHCCVSRLINSSRWIVLISWSQVGVEGVGESVMGGALIIFEILNFRRRTL